MNNANQSKITLLALCLFIGPLLQLIGDALWLNGNYRFSWSIWREVSYVFFIPCGFFFARLIERKSFSWAAVFCALFIVGCFGSATMMPLFRLGAFYPIESHNAFPVVVTSVLDKKLFGATLYPLGLCLPVSLVVLGILLLKYRLTKIAAGIAFILSGIFFWLGNAGEMDTILIVGDACLLVTFCYTGYLIYGNDFLQRGGKRHSAIA